MDQFRCRLIPSPSQEETLRSVSQVSGWCERSFRALSRSSSESQQFNKDIASNHKRWTKIISRYYTDIENFPYIRDEIYTDLVNQAALKLCKSSEHVEQVFSQAAEKQEFPKLEIGSLCQKVPSKMADELILQAGMEKFIDLLLRYHILLVSEGLFLSIEPDLMQMFIDGSTKPVVEPFGSPFNHNCPEYCSLFEEDADFGALPPFAQYIDRLDIAVRLIANPPYTPRCIAMCVNKVIAYLDRIPTAEIIMLLPIMYHYEAVDRMLAYGNTQSCLLTKGEHTVYSFFSETRVQIPTKLYLIVNIENSERKSAQMLAEIVEWLGSKVER